MTSPDRGEEGCWKTRDKYKPRGQRGISWESKVTMKLLDLCWCWNDVYPGTRQIESKGTMPALCCYDTHISLKMTLKSNRGSNTVLFICSLGRALILRGGLSTAEYDPCQENLASGMRASWQVWHGKPAQVQGVHNYCPLPPSRAASVWDTEKVESPEETPPQGVDHGFILCKSVERLLVTQAVSVVPPYVSGHVSGLRPPCSGSCTSISH